MIRQPSDKVQRSGWCLALGRNRAVQRQVNRKRRRFTIKVGENELKMEGCCNDTIIVPCSPVYLPKEAQMPSDPSLPENAFVQ